MTSDSDTDREYWKHYTGIQAAKHSLLKRYLGGWFPILTAFAGRVLYVDCHAGRGRHRSGDLGSPMVALNTLLTHRALKSIVAKCEVHFILLENNPKHVKALEDEIEELGPLPGNVKTSIVARDYEQELRDALDELQKKQASLAPSFFFLDPYGFVLPMDLMQKILVHPKTELLITFMLRYIDMAIRNPNQERNLDKLFGSKDWRSLKSISDPDQRHEETVTLYSKGLGAEFCSVLEMRGVHKELKYVLLHASNHRRGRELMKEALWKLTPHGSFVIYQSADPRQKVLITLQPDLEPLEDKLMSGFRDKQVQYSELQEWLLPSSWHYPHLNSVIRKLKNEGKINAIGYSGRFAFSKNPVIQFEN